ncbi:hypothetical protein MMC18_003102 [Xylographa bjoerkii]|nr:hypothetical protein [Xylographa bjoerkii]
MPNPQYHVLREDFLKLQYPSLNPKPTIAAGYEVIATASPKNFEYVKKLGASQVFNYKSNTIVDELVAATKDKTTAGVLNCICVNGAIQACADTLSRCVGNKFIATCMHPPENLAPESISFKFIFGSSLRNNEVSKVIFEDFLPQAMAKGKFVAAPDPHVAGKDLEYVQEGIDVWKKGVSAQKIMVSL